MSLRDLIANADDLYAETLEVPEWNITLTLRTPTVAERAAMIRRFVGQGNGEPNTDLNEMYPALLIATCVNPDTNEMLFTEADADLIRSKNGTVVERIAMVALRLCGMSDDAVPLPNGDSSSMGNAPTSTD